METKIREKLRIAFHPTVLKITDESSLHAGHREGGQKQGTHFKIEMVSEWFEGKSRLERHQAVYEVLAPELKAGVHALSLILKTSQETRTSTPL